ncbi:uncharacterized protein B0J16DRAFT_394024 [Fusarium flagelliforme]|uniref:uncharacterized protein n=1 Tax=Fusarium flagelliforme TaxID=2675880 RepID=UPI001E8D289B|nr:uncharacterized protein B0J16DRAFT_394024 [Fusarium flagelliforme]KAH7191914.1 hypothetical protein B0J16DRAFT_394024 [Fusarium flagelliforme]
MDDFQQDMKYRDLRNIFKDTGAWSNDIVPELIKSPSNVKLNEHHSSLDCIVQLIRHCNSLLPRIPDNQGESDNRLLEYTWQIFVDGRNAVDARQIATKADLLKYLEQATPGDKTFMDLFCSDLMNRTIWSSPEWRLVHAFAVIRDDEWVAEEPTDPNTIGSANMVQIDCGTSPDLQLEEAVKLNRELRDREAIIPASPIFILVHYTPNVNKSRKFADLVSFKTINGIAEGRWIPSPPLAYSLIAMVRMDGETKQSEMRTYIPRGVPVSTEPGVSYTNNGMRWSLEDTNASYMLVYGTAERDPRMLLEMPDRKPPPRSQERNFRTQVKMVQTRLSLQERDSRSDGGKQTRD